MDYDFSNRFEEMMGSFLQAIPAIVGALVVLFIGYFVAKALSALVHNGLHRAGLDTAVEQAPGGSFVQKVASSPSRLIGGISFWAVMLGAISLAVSVLGINALNNVLGAVYAYLPNVIAAFAIFLVAGIVSASVSSLASRTMGDTPTGKMLATLTPGLVMSIAVFMILNQLRIAPEIVTITFAALIGSVALGMALAFGLGGRDVASRMLEQAYTKGQEAYGQARADMQLGKDRAATMASDLRAKVEAEATQTPQAGHAQAPQPTFGERIEPDQNSPDHFEPR